MADGSSSLSAYIYGDANTSDNQIAYLQGAINITWQISAYAQGASNLTSNIPCYILGGIAPSASIPAYLAGIVQLAKSTRSAYLMGILRANINAYLEGTNLFPGDPEMAEYDYIWLKSSDDSMQYKFRVLQAGYDDGTLEKAEQLRRTVGGGLDHSQGAIYQSWSPTIRVRHTEPETNYGTTADLKALYMLNNPNGTPSNVITFIDHHGDSYYVRMLGTFRKNLLGTSIEGNQAWSIIQLALIEVS
jgi:hypothetical protein